jgi:hypothetical protein
MTGVLVPLSFLFLRPDPRSSNSPSTDLRDTVSAVTSAEASSKLVTRRIAEEMAERRKGLDPRHDGWDTEVIVEEAKAQLRLILAELRSGSKFEAERSESKLSAIVTTNVVCSPLRPPGLQQEFQDDSIQVLRPRGGLDAPPFHGRHGLVQSMAGLAMAFRPETESIHTELHVNAVTTKGEVAATKALVELVGRDQGHTVQISTTWDCLWQRQKVGPPLLSAIRVASYEEAATLSGGGVWFADCTESVLGSNSSFRQQLAFGLDHWLKRIERGHYMHVFAATGLSVGDVNGDKLDDLYVCQPGGLPNRLYVQKPDGSAEDVSSQAHVDWLDHSSSALILDLDNDADQDLAVATLAGVLVMENDSSGKFRLKAVLSTAGADTQSMCTADYDNDGDLDIYVCMNFAKTTSQDTTSKAPFVYHDANDGAPNRLFRNDVEPGGKWNFADVTLSSGLNADNSRHSLAAAWEDYDNDGDQDLYVANDYGQNCLYRNDAGRFTNVAGDLGVVDFGSGMSVSWGDFNRDGWMDLYVGNMFSSAGSRITPQQRFRPGLDPRVRQILRRFAKGNSLFANVAGNRFQEVGADARVEMGRWAWSSLFVDVDNSGWDDLFVANGYITTEDTGDL